MEPGRWWRGWVLTKDGPGLRARLSYPHPQDPFRPLTAPVSRRPGERENENTEKGPFGIVHTLSQDRRGLCHDPEQITQEGRGDLLPHLVPAARPAHHAGPLPRAARRPHPLKGSARGGGRAHTAQQLCLERSKSFPIQNRDRWLRGKFKYKRDSPWPWWAGSGHFPRGQAFMKVPLGQTALLTHPGCADKTAGAK